VKDKYGITLLQLLNEDAWFGPPSRPPAEDKSKDIEFWRDHKISAEAWREAGCKFAMTIPRPRVCDPGVVIRNQPIEAFDTHLRRGQQVVERLLPQV
jgi:hypothetical protein